MRYKEIEQIIYNVIYRFIRIIYNNIIVISRIYLANIFLIRAITDGCVLFDIACCIAMKI